MKLVAVMIALTVTTLLPSPSFSEDFKVLTLRVPGARQVNTHQARQIVRIGTNLYLQKAVPHDTTIVARTSRLKSDPCPGMSDITLRFIRFSCLWTWYRANPVGSKRAPLRGVVYDAVYLMLPPMTDSNGILWNAGQAWICSSRLESNEIGFSVGNAHLKMYQGQSRDRWWSSIVAYAHENLHVMGAYHIFAPDNIMAPDATSRAINNRVWPLPLLHKTKEDVWLCSAR